MTTVDKVADRVVMLTPYSRMQHGQPQILFDGTPAELRACTDRQVREFVEGQADRRVHELARSNNH
jgi:phospholipid/cholesterol/gamma-HCH transport system ATP-binding protein